MLILNFPFPVSETVDSGADIRTGVRVLINGQDVNLIELQRN
jgi:hypothetical protein